MPILFCALSGVVFDDSFAPAIEFWRRANGGLLAVDSPEQLRDEAYLDFCAGRLSGVDYLHHLRGRLGWEDGDRALREGWDAALGPVRLDTLDVLGRLRDDGWTLVAATNTDPWHEETRLRRDGWAMGIFDRVVWSSRIGVCKPDARFFTELTRDLPRHGPMIYCDARPQNVAAARRSGLDGHLYADPLDLWTACRAVVPLG